VTDLHEAAIDARKKRKEWKAKRDRLFEHYLKDPSNTSLALEIKTIDDKIAESIDRHSTKQPIQR
jgi:hypothetical protein